MPLEVLIVNPNPLLNLVHAGPLRLHDINRVDHLQLVAEGKGVNVARVLARHGHRVALTGFAGGQSGAWLRELTREAGIWDLWIETAAPLRVGFMASDAADSHPTTVLPRGFSVSGAECRALLAGVAAALPGVRLVIGSGSVPHPAADGLYADLAALCQRAGTPCWLDAYGEAMAEALKAAAPLPLAKPNREEYAELRGWDRIEELHLTAGPAPVEVRSRRHGDWRVVPPSVRQVNPVGSGDCYLAGLAHAWLVNLDFPDRLRYAAAAGAANAIRPDVAMIVPQDIAPLVDSVRVAAVRP